MDIGGFLDGSNTTLSGFLCTPRRRNCRSERQVSFSFPLEAHVGTTPVVILVLRIIALTREAEAPMKATLTRTSTTLVNISVA